MRAKTNDRKDILYVQDFEFADDLENSYDTLSKTSKKLRLSQGKA